MNFGRIILSTLFLLVAVDEMVAQQIELTRKLGQACVYAHADVMAFIDDVFDESRCGDSVHGYRWCEFYSGNYSASGEYFHLNGVPQYITFRQYNNGVETIEHLTFNSGSFKNWTGSIDMGPAYLSGACLKSLYNPDQIKAQIKFLSPPTIALQRLHLPCQTCIASMVPSDVPSFNPTSSLSPSSSNEPSFNPTVTPSLSPSIPPSDSTAPSGVPSFNPTATCESDNGYLKSNITTTISDNKFYATSPSSSKLFRITLLGCHADYGIITKFCRCWNWYSTDCSTDCGYESLKIPTDFDGCYEQRDVGKWSFESTGDFVVDDDYFLYPDGLTGDERNKFWTVLNNFEQTCTTTATPSVSTAPSNNPSATVPSDTPSNIPSIRPSLSPSNNPSTAVPSNTPSNRPSIRPSLSPSNNPSTAVPSNTPSNRPSTKPSEFPSNNPSTIVHSDTPSNRPSARPSLSPSNNQSTPAATPSVSTVPSNNPSIIVPSNTPSTRPSASPSSVAFPPIVTPTATNLPSEAPSGATTSAECNTDEALLFELEFQLGSNSGNLFSWELTNKKVATSGWKGSRNGSYPSDERFVYSICLPYNECWNLSLSDAGSNDYYKLSIAGEEIDLETNDNDGSSVTKEICIGRSRYCSERKNGFKIKKRKTSRKKKRVHCHEIRDFGTVRRRKNYCKRRRVKQECLVTCGKIGKGNCLFLQAYGDAEMHPLAPATVLPISPGAIVV